MADPVVAWSPHWPCLLVAAELGRAAGPGVAEGHHAVAQRAVAGAHHQGTAAWRTAPEAEASGCCRSGSGFPWMPSRKSRLGVDSTGDACGSSGWASEGTRYQID